MAASPSRRPGNPARRRGRDRRRLDRRPRVPPRARRPIRGRRPRRPGPLRRARCRGVGERWRSCRGVGAPSLRAATRPERARRLVRPVRQRHGVRVRHPATPHDERSPHRGPRAADGARPRRRGRRVRCRRRRRGRDPGDARGVTDPERALGTRAHRSRQTRDPGPAPTRRREHAAVSGWSPSTPPSITPCHRSRSWRRSPSASPVGSPLASRVVPSRLVRAGAWASRFALTGLAVHVVLGLRVARAPRAVYRSLLLAPKAIVWKVNLWLRMLVRPGEVNWIRTTRNADQPATKVPPT